MRGFLSPFSGLLRRIPTDLFYLNAFYLWLHMLIGSLGNLLFLVIVSRLYSPEAVGLGMTAVSALMYLGMLSQLGLGYGLISLLPTQKAGAPALINTSFGAGVVASLLAAFIFVLGLPWWSPELLFLQQPLFFAAFMAFTALVTLYFLLDYTFIAWRRAQLVVIRGLAFQGLRFPLPFVLGALIAFGIVASVGLAVAAGVAVGILFLYRLYPEYKLKSSLAPRRLLKMAAFSLGNHLSEMLLVAPNFLLPIMVLNLLDAERAAYFYTSWFTGYLLLYMSGHLALSLFAEGTHQPQLLLQLTRNGLVVGGAVAALGLVFVFLLGDRLLLLFGREYSLQGTRLLWLVALASLPATLTHLYIGVERVRQKVGAVLFITAVVAGLTLGISLFLLPRMGIIGAGVGLLIGQSGGAAIAILRSPRRQLVTELLRLLPL